MSGMWKRSMAEMLGHSQTKERATGNPNLSLYHRATSRLYPDERILTYRDVRSRDARSWPRGDLPLTRSPVVPSARLAELRTVMVKVWMSGTDIKKWEVGSETRLM
jgi:hypothetical protein